jgi:hypothetical protein
MAKKKETAILEHLGSTAGRARSRRAGGARRRTSGARAQMAKAAEMLSAGTNGVRGWIAEARDMARSVGDSTVGAARGVAKSARSAATGVAKGTQNSAVGVAEYVRDHPVPALLVGAGATWMIVEAARGNGHAKRRGRRKSSRRNGNVVGRAASVVADAGKYAGSHVVDFVRENPLLVGAATLGVGVAVGMALPGSDAENSLLGETRDAVVRRAKEVARGTVQSMREVGEGMQRMAGGKR